MCSRAVRARGLFLRPVHSFSGYHRNLNLDIYAPNTLVVETAVIRYNTMPTTLRARGSQLHGARHHPPVFLLHPSSAPRRPRFLCRRANLNHFFFRSQYEYHLCPRLTRRVPPYPPATLNRYLDAPRRRAPGTHKTLKNSLETQTQLDSYRHEACYSSSAGV